MSGCSMSLGTGLVVMSGWLDDGSRNGGEGKLNRGGLLKGRGWVGWYIYPFFSFFFWQDGMA
jgi:hypothetical protein